ncbi:MAG: amidase [Gemmatimonadales bacterium]|nr:amidase [Gemmatimonadales bacterium]
MKRRDFIGRAAAGAAIATRVSGGAAPHREPPQGGFALEEVSVADLQQQMTAGRTTARRLVDQYAARIEWLDRRGPLLGHVLEINPDAREIADQMDQERRAGHVRSPMHGIPVLIKDNIATLDRMETTAGSYALVGARPPRDSFIARKLREAGAVILGKTNLSEWANFRSSRSVSGWSGRGGQCRNPYALDRTPSGSSSGSGVAVAASSCAVAIGTETSGSIISPASACGVVGVKPTVGLISRAGVIPIAHSQDTAGPMARTVTDAAALLTVLAGSDPADEVTAEADARKSDYTRALDADGLRGARLGVLRGMNTEPRLLARYDAAIAVLRQRGAEIVDPVTIATQQQLTSGGDLLQYEFKADLERYLAEWAPTASVRTLDDLIAFNRREAAREMPYFQQETFEASARRGPLTTPEYVELKERLQRLARAEGIDATMDTNRLDALVAVSAGAARHIDLVSGDGGGGGGAPSGTGIAATAGYPHVTVPMGYIHGLPVGLSFFGRAWSESLLLKFAFAYEQASRARHAPVFAATASVPWDGRGI